MAEIGRGRHGRRSSAGEIRLVLALPVLARHHTRELEHVAVRCGSDGLNRHSVYGLATSVPAPGGVFPCQHELALRPRGTLALFGQSSGSVPAFDPSILNAKGSLFLTRPGLPHYLQTREEIGR